MKVIELMSPRPITVGPETPLRNVLQLMLRFHLNDVLIVGDRQELSGIVTYSDLIRSLLPTEVELMEHQEYLYSPESMEDRFQEWAAIPVHQIMTRRVLTVSPNLAALKAAALMTANRVKQLPVIRDDALIGIISYADIGWGLLFQNSFTTRTRVSARARPESSCDTRAWQNAGGNRKLPAV